MSGEAPTAETPTEHASGAAPATGGAAAVPEPSGDERNPVASGSILGIRSDVPGTSDDERPSAGDVQGSYEPTVGAKRHKKSTPQSITQQALEAMHARQHAYTRGIGGIGVAPEKAEAKAAEKAEAKAAATSAGGGGGADAIGRRLAPLDTGPMAPVTASALRAATASQISQIPVFQDQRRAADAARAYDDVVVPSYQSRHENRELTSPEEKRTGATYAPPRALPTLLPRPPGGLAPPGPTERLPTGYDSMIQEKIDYAVERNRLRRAAEMAAASAAIQAAQAARAAQAQRDQDARGVVSAQHTQEVWDTVARESARYRRDAGAPPSTSALDRARPCSAPRTPRTRTAVRRVARRAVPDADRRKDALQGAGCVVGALVERVMRGGLERRWRRRCAKRAEGGDAYASRADERDPRPREPAGAGAGAGAWPRPRRGRGRGRGASRASAAGGGATQSRSSRGGADGSASGASDESGSDSESRSTGSSGALGRRSTGRARDSERRRRGVRRARPRSATYFALEDDTPFSVGRKLFAAKRAKSQTTTSAEDTHDAPPQPLAETFDLECCGNAIVALNERRLPGLRLRSKLHEGTRLWLSPGSPEEKAHAHKTLVRARCAAVLAALQKHECALIFSEAVDHVALNIPDYPEIVKRPMDLGTVKKKLEAGAYDERGPSAFVADAQLAFENCLLYNPRGSEARKMGEIMLKELRVKWVALGF